jgi:hypothetical protein
VICMYMKKLNNPKQLPNCLKEIHLNVCSLCSQYSIKLTDVTTELRLSNLGFTNSISRNCIISDISKFFTERYLTQYKLTTTLGLVTQSFIFI